MLQYFNTSNDFLKELYFSFLITSCYQWLSMLCQNKLGSPFLFIAFLKCSKQNYQLDQVLENFKYSFYFDGITLKRRLRLHEESFSPFIGLEISARSNGLKNLM